MLVYIVIPLHNYIFYYILDFYVLDNDIYILILYFISIPYIPFYNISDVRLLSKMNEKILYILNPFYIRLIPKLWGSNGFVLIITKTGLIKHYIISPKNSIEFVNRFHELAKR